MMKLILPFVIILLSPLFCVGQQFNFVTNLQSTVNETSGVIYLNNRLITHNDGGNPNALYELSIEDGTVIRTVTINNATNTDWEDITYDDEYIYIADIGNNSGDRTDLKVYKISISDYFDSDNTVTAEAIEFSYADQTDFTPRDFHDFDAEALISYNNNLYIFTKNRETWGTTNIYKLPKTPGSHIISQADHINYKEPLTEAELITGATYEKATNKILLTGNVVNYSKVIISSFIVELSDFTSGNFSAGNINRISIDTNGESEQIESITHFTKNKYYLTAEKGSSTSSSLHILENSSTDKYRIMFNTDPSTEATIGWGQVYGTNQKVCYDTNPDADWNNCPNAISPFRSIDYLSMHNQFVKLTGLIPDTKYYFVIKDSEGISERFWFKTVSDNNNERLSIISGGDSRYDTGLANFDEAVFREYRKNSNRLVAKLRPHAVFFGGDLIGGPGKLPDTMAKWLDDWQLTITSDHQIIPVVHSYGNHESDNPDGDILTLNRLFDTPADSYYNVRFGGDLFSYYVLNGELLPEGTVVDDTKRITQRNWLQQGLENDNSIWKTAGYHRPIAPHNSGKVASYDSYNDWVSTFYDNEIRLIFESDAHLVKLTEELKPTSATANGDDPENWFTSANIDLDKGFTFIGGGSWGVIREADRSYTYTIAEDSFYAFNLLFIDKCSIEIRTLKTQDQGQVSERTENNIFDLDGGLNNVLWKPAGLPSGVKTIYKSSIWNGSSWACGEPNLEKNAIIKDDYYLSDGNIEVMHLEIEPNARLNFDNNTNNGVIVHGDLTIDGEFIIGDTESLIMADNDAIISGEITKKEKSATKDNIHDVTYWSSPVEGTSSENGPELSSVFPDTDTSRMFKLDPENYNPIYAENPKYEHWWQYAGLMYQGIGYSVEGKTSGVPTQMVSFTGKPHNGLIKVPVYLGISSVMNVETENKNSNLIGNPYPSAIDPDKFIDINLATIDGTIYVWNQETNYSSGLYSENDYLSYTMSGPNSTQLPDPYYIASGEGFMVIATSNTDVVFNNGMRFDSDNKPIADNAHFYKSGISKVRDGKKNRIWLRLTNENNRISEQLIGFFADATDGLDYGWDGKSINASEFNFFSILGDQKYAIQGLGVFTMDKTISLGLETKNTGELTIGVSKTEGELKEIDVYLEDRVLNKIHNLSVEDYKFNQDKVGEVLDRFTIKFNSSTIGIDEFEKDNNFIISNTDTGLYIKTNKMVVDIKLYDALGRLLLDKQPNASSFYLNDDHIKKGTILISRLTLENNTILSEKIIKY